MTIVSMFKNNNEVDNLRDSGYAGADFEVGNSPVMFDNGIGFNKSILNQKGTPPLLNELERAILVDAIESVDRVVRKRGMDGPSS